METAPFEATAALHAVNALRSHFNSGASRSYKARRDALRALAKAVHAHEADILSALHAEMRRPAFESYLSEVGLLQAEIAHALEHLREWMRPQQPSTPLVIQIAASEIHWQPKGVVLIVAPWNYPLLMLLSPLVGAIAAGNCAVLKPSEDSPHAAAVVERIIATAGLGSWVTVVKGEGHVAVPALINGFRFDHILFTGSARVGALVAAQAAPQLVPITLELGGKNPTIVDRRTNLKLAAKRIAWGKCFNAGQTCISPDHVLVHAEVIEPFIEAYIRTLKGFYGDDPRQSPHYGRIANKRRFDVLRGYLDHGRIRYGGEHAEAEHYIAPTVLTDVPLDTPPMQDEIFGPILPVRPWREREEVLDIVQRSPAPLACYIFSKDADTVRYFNERIAFGGGCVDHVMAQVGNPDLPFGGIGHSGMGKYHGRHGFETFSHAKSLVRAGTLLDPGVQYPPYTAFKNKVLRWVLR